MTVTSNNYISDITLKLKVLIRDNITDPLVAYGKRDSKSKFVMTAYPQRLAQYPLITIKFSGQVPFQNTGQRSETLYESAIFEVRVWARNMKEKEQLTSQVINLLRQSQIGANSTIDFGMYDFRINSIVPVDEIGDAGIKSNVIELRYNVDL